MLAENDVHALPDGSVIHEYSGVTSETFPEYLSPDAPLPLYNADLPDTLDLAQFTADFLILDQYAKMDFVLAPEDRAVLTDSLSAATNDPMLTSLRERSLALINQQGVMERGNTTYYDPESQQIFVSGITDGMHKTVITDVFQLIRNGKDPRIAKHSHPIPSLPSPADLRLHLQEARPEYKPPVRASITLCPGMQLMTLVTAESAGVLDHEEMMQFIDYWTQRAQTEGKDERDVIDASSKRIFEQQRQLREQQTTRGMKALNELVAISHERQLTHDELAYFNTEFSRLESITHEPVDPQAIPEYVMAQKAYFDHLNSSSNRVLIEMLRSVNLAVYISHDMRTFEKVLI